MKRFFIPLLIVAALGGAAYAYVLNRQADGPLTGQPVSRSVADRRAIAVIFDNFSPDARPQSGLDQASLVFETLAEGGITRFMGVYQEHDAPKTGPVRSTRLYFNSWAAGLDVIFGHDGGNVDALQQLPSLTTVYNIDADRVVGPFYRTSDRAAPHNEYTSTSALRSYAESHGGATTGAPDAIPHKSDAPSGQRPAQFTINIQFSYSDYNVTWQYSPVTNDFARFMGGAPHLEASTGQQLRAKNVIVMRTVETPAYDPYTPGAIHLATTGTGAATVYEDGKAIQGHWSKPSIDSPLQWLDNANNPIPLNKGPTWIEVVPQGNSVTGS
ncbi:MAG TPA: DUF3048 domain-containing protein [Chloroflexota bacterium]